MSVTNAKAILTRETFRFFKDLTRNNRKVWMDANRERYQSAVVQPFRHMLEELTPEALRLNSQFDVCGRTGPNFSRINRDIRFAKDKTPYRTHMYLKFCVPAPNDRETGQLYVGVSADTVTAGFRMYSDGKRKESTLALISEPRVNADPKWITRQKKRLGRRYQSYWYSMEKGEWTKHDGWPITLEDWKKILGWIVRRKMSPATARRAAFSREVVKIFREVYPLLTFTSLSE